MTMTKPKLLVSACLLGENCKYSGGNNRNEQVRALERYFQLIPVCPECFGGLPIPREPSEIRDGCVVSKSGVDVTAAFADGAEKTLYIAEEENCGLALLKERSPSCGSRFVYDGTFTGTVVPGQGVTAALLAGRGVELFSEETIARLLLLSGRDVKTCLFCVCGVDNARRLKYNANKESEGFFHEKMVYPLYGCFVAAGRVCRLYQRRIRR